MRHTLRSIINGIVLVALIPAFACAAERPIAIGTLPQGSLGFSIAAAIAKVATEQTKLQVRAIGQGGSSVYIPEVNSDEMQFGTSNTFETIFATQGTGNFVGHPNKNLRIAAMLVPFQVGFMVAKDSNIRTVTDLKGRPFPTGYAKQKLVEIMQNAIFHAVGMSEKDIKSVPVPNFVKGAELLAEGKVAGVLLAPGSGVVKKTYAERPVRFITIPNDPKVERNIQQSLPGSKLVEVKPNKRLLSIANPVYLVQYQYALVTNATVSDKTVYDLVKAIYEHKTQLAAAFGIFHKFNPADMAPQLSGATYHPGAIKFYKEVGLWKK